jgi:hypothetical protein
MHDYKISIDRLNDRGIKEDNIAHVQKLDDSPFCLVIRKLDGKEVRMHVNKTFLESSVREHALILYWGISKKELDNYGVYEDNIHSCFVHSAGVLEDKLMSIITIDGRALIIRKKFGKENFAKRPCTIEKSFQDYKVGDDVYSEDLEKFRHEVGVWTDLVNFRYNFHHRYPRQ